jgi:hypothetical protein
MREKVKLTEMSIVNLETQPLLYSTAEKIGTLAKSGNAPRYAVLGGPEHPGDRLALLVGSGREPRKQPKIAFTASSISECQPTSCTVF